MADSQWLEQAAATVCAAREHLTTGLQAMGFDVLPSQANFIFTQHNTFSGKRLFDALRERDIVVRRWDRPRIENWLRISVGTREQVETLLAVVQEVVATKGG